MFRGMCATGLLLCLAGSAMGQAVDGKLKPEYGAIRWWNTTPTQFADAQSVVPGVCDPIGAGIQITLNNSNRAGITGTTADPMAAAAVTTGFEVKIPLSSLGVDVNALPTTVSVKIAGMIMNSDYQYSSNQYIVTGGTPGSNAPSNYPQYANTIDLTAFQGTHSVTASALVADLTILEPTLDGTLDAPFYGAALMVQSTQTNYGDLTDAQTGLQTILYAHKEDPNGGGSEIDAVYARISKDGTGSPALYLFIAGNLQSKYNKLALFFDSIAGGQNVLRNDNGSAIFGGGANSLGGGGSAPNPGLKFDADFAADFFMGMNVGPKEAADPTLFADWQRLRPTPTDAGSGRFIGSSHPTGATPVVFTASDPCPPFVPPTYADFANGSEIDGLYATVCGDYLYVLVTGNLENGDNRLDLFFDVGTVSVPLTSVGQNRLKGTEHPFDYGHLNRLGENHAAPVAEPGLKFSTGFDADYWLSFSIGGYPATVNTYAGLINSLGVLTDGGFPTPVNLEYGSFGGGLKSANSPLVFDGLKCVRTDAMNMCTPNGAGSAFNPTSIPGIDIQGDPVANGLPVVAEAYSSFAPRLISQDVFNPLGISDGVHPPSVHPNLAEAGLISTAIDNSNHGGVTSGDATQARRVTTGMEAKIRLDELGYSGSGPIRITGFVVSKADNGCTQTLPDMSVVPCTVIVSNQVIGGSLPTGTGNLNEPRTLDFNSFAGGPFYVEISPPFACASATAGACCFDATSCVLMSATQCAAAGGVAVGGSCSPLPCGVQQVGICCSSSGVCTIATPGIPATCPSGQAFTENGTCGAGNAPCVQPQVGICCTSGACTTAIAGDALGSNVATCETGSLTVNGTCTPNTCPQPPAGVCCRGATCSTAFTSAAACQGATTTSATGGPGWAFVNTAAPCNAGVNADGNYSGALTSTQSPCCFANYNHSPGPSGLEVQDIFDFLNDWFAGRPIAIPGGDGTSNSGLAVQNIFNFLNAWFAGGCS